jgi:hypothetical protein
MIHESAAKRVHPEAKEFKPISSFGKIIGWIFEIPQGEGVASIDWGWVTSDGEVSQDRLARSEDAVRNLKAYRKQRRQNRQSRSVSPVGKHV